MMLGNFVYYDGGTSLKYGQFWKYLGPDSANGDYYSVVPFILEGPSQPVTHAETEYVCMVVLDTTLGNRRRVSKDVTKTSIFVFHLNHFLNREVIYRHGVDDVFGITHTECMGIRMKIEPTCGEQFSLRANMELYENFKFRYHLVFSRLLASITYIV